MDAADGKKRKIKAANTESVLPIIQFIPSPKGEAFKQWLASVVAERIAEIENPELAQQRIKDTYKTKRLQQCLDRKTNKRYCSKR